MSEFSTSATVDVQVSSSSLRQARGTIEDELGDVTVGVSSSSGGSRIAGRERAMGRQLQSETNEHLAGIDSHWTDNLELNRERNDLLRQLVDVTERQAQTSSGGRGMIGSTLMTVAGIGAAGIGLGSMLLDHLSGRLAEAIPDLNPSDVVDAVKVTASNVIDSAANVSPSDVVETAATISPAAVIASKAAITATDVVESKTGIDPVDVIATAATITPAAVIASKAVISPSDVIESKTGIDPVDVIATAATISPAALIASKASISPSDVIGSAVDLAPTDIVTGTVTASEIMDHVFDSGESGSGTDSGDGGIDPLAVVGGAGAAGYAALRKYGGRAGQAARGGAGRVGGAAPVFTPSMVNPEMEGLEGTVFDEDHWLRQAGRAEPRDVGRESRTDRGAEILEDYDVPSSDVTLEQDNTVEVNADMSDLEREAQQAFDEFEQRLSDLERALSRR